MKIPEADLSENITIQGTDLEIRKFHDLKIAAGAYFFRFTRSAGDREIARDKGIKKTEILRELAGAVTISAMPSLMIIISLRGAPSAS